MKTVTKKPLSQKKLKAVLVNPSLHLIGAEIRSDVVHYQVTIEPRLENVGISEGVMATTVIALPKNARELERYENIFEVMADAHLGFSYLETDGGMGSSLVATMDPDKFQDPLLRSHLSILIEINSLAWYREFKVAGVKTVEIMLTQKDSAGEYHLRLLFSEENNLHGLSSYINSKLDSNHIEWLLSNVLSGIFGSRAEMVDMQLRSAGVSLLVPLNGDVIGRRGHIICNEDGTMDSLSIGGMNLDGGETTYGSISLSGVKGELTESSGAYALRLTKDVNKNTVDHITIYIR